jgi:hypothetical protein
MTSLARACLVAFLLVSSATLLAEELMVIETIKLQHRLVKELLPTIQSLLAPGGTAAAANEQLILRSTPANIADLKHVIATLDVRQHSLRISVRQNVQDATQSAADGLAARAKLGDAQVAVGGLSAGPATGGALRFESNGVAVESYHTDGQSEQAGSYFVTTVEGSPAFINTGQSVPLPQTTATLTPFGASVQDSLNYREVGSGFYVTPYLHGEEVTLEISPYTQQLDRSGGGVIAEHSAQSVVRGRVNEWIALGGTGTSAQDDEHAELHSTRRAARDAYDVWVKVEVLP